MNKYLRGVVFAGIFLIPFIPLIVTPSLFFPFITGKNFTFRILVELMFVAWVLLALRDPSYRPRFSLVFAAFLSFVAIIGVADFHGVNPSRSFWSNYERMEGLVTLLHLFGYFLVLGSVMTSKLWLRLFNTTLGVSFIMVLYGFSQLLGWATINQGGVRTDGTLGNATYLAIYLVFHMFMALMLMVRGSTSRFMSYCYGALALLQGIVLYHTATRGAILGMLGGLLLTAFIVGLFEKDRPHLRKIALATIVGVVVVIVGFWSVRTTSFVQNSPVLNRFATITWSNQKDQARAYVWPMAIAGFKEKPLLGWGQENFNYVFNSYYDPRMYNQEPWFDRAHDVFLDWLIAGGLLGLLAYLSLYGLGLYSIWKKGDLSLAERAIITGLFAAYFFHNIFVFDNITSYILFTLFLAYLHTDVSRPFGGRVESLFGLLYKNESIRNKVVIPVVVLVSIFGIYAANYPAYAANKDLIASISNSQISVTDRIAKFQEALSYNTFANQEIREQLVQLAFSARNSQIDLKDKQAVFTLASNEYLKMIAEIPNDARHRLFLGLLYDQYGSYGDAIKQLTAASELSPRKQSILFALGDAYVHAGNYQEAVGVFKKAFELNKDYANARISYAAAAVYAGDQELVRSLLLPVYGTVAVPSDQLLQAYFDTRQFGYIVEMWQNQVKSNPLEARSHMALAAAYTQVGRMGEAVTEASKAAELEKDATTKVQYQSIVSQLRAGNNPFTK